MCSTPGCVRYIVRHVVRLRCEIGREIVQGSLGFQFQGEGFGVLFFEALDDVSRCASDKAFIAELLVGGFEALVEFGEVLGEALALGGDIDLAFVNDGNVKRCCTAGVVAGWRGGDEINRADAGQAGKHVGVGVGERGYAGVRVKMDGGRFLLGDSELLAQATDRDDELLKDVHRLD